VAPDRVDLREQRDIGARIVRFDGRAHTRAAGTDDEDVVLGLHHFGRYTMPPAGGRRKSRPEGPSHPAALPS
jgi:hypothetical protein